MNIDDKIKAIVAALEDIKAQDITVLDTSRLTSLFERMVIASAESSRQTKALANSVRDKMKELGEQVIGMEGEETGEWVLVDMGDVVVHVMHPAVRAHYNLEELWDATLNTRNPSASS
jgi:ribosome-associated protein